MASSSVKLFNDPTNDSAKPNKFIFEKARRNEQGGGWNVNISTVPDGNRFTKPRFRFPKCAVPFGWQEPMEAGKGKPKIELQCSRDSDMVAWAQSLKDAVVRYTVDNCVMLMKKQQPEAVLQSLFNSALKIPDDVSKQPLLRVKLNPDGEFKTNVYVHTGRTDPVTGRPVLREGTIQDIGKGCEVETIVEAGLLWYVKEFGVTLVATDVLVYPAARRQGYDENMWSEPMVLERAAAAAGAVAGAGEAAAPAAEGDADMSP
jgi:hypothetical protein